MMGTSSFGYPSVTGNIRVPEPAAAMTPVSIFIYAFSILQISKETGSLRARYHSVGLRLKKEDSSVMRAFSPSLKARGEGGCYGRVFGWLSINYVEPPKRLWC